VVEHPLYKQEALSSNPSLIKKKKKKVVGEKWEDGRAGEI
jgi:hypothetical protein